MGYVKDYHRKKTTRLKRKPSHNSHIGCFIPIQFSLVQFSHSVMSNSLRPHEPQHTRPPCPSPTPRAYPNSCPLEKTLESAMDCKEIQPVLKEILHPKGDQSWVFTERTDVEAETPVRWPPDVKSWLIWKDPDLGKHWGQEEKGMTEDEMVGWHHRLNGRGFGWTPGVGDGQGGLVCCGSWGHKELDTTEQLNWTENCSKNKVC